MRDADYFQIAVSNGSEKVEDSLIEQEARRENPHGDVEMFRCPSVECESVRNAQSQHSAGRYLENVTT